jgi:antitoxin component YwqK of YwqJK toxin-antitoxin module
MTFEITDGLGLVSIGLSEIGSYFYFRKPITTLWWDCHGSAGKYICQLPYDEAIKTQIRNRVVDNLNVDYTGKPDELKTLLDPLLKVFRNGEYTIEYNNSESNTFLENWSYRGDESRRFHWSTVFGSTVQLANLHAVTGEYDNMVEEKKAKGQRYWGMLEYTTGNFYDGMDLHFIATQPRSEINEARVKYFEDRILHGERPFAIIFNSHYHKIIKNIDNTTSLFTLDSDNFILDGHHKLLAYENLKIKPSLAVISHLAKTRSEIEFNAEALIGALYPWQVEHILKNWHEKEQFIAPFLEDPQSNIHLFIKNGHHKAYYKNGQLKHEAFYINDHIEGEGKWWHENGQLQEVQYFKNQLRVGEWKQWYPSGKLLFIQPFNDYGRYHGHMISYFESGQIRWEQHLVNGVHVDGYSYFVWYEDGTKEAELKYLNGQMIERKNYNREGKLINFEEFDFETRKYIKRV